MPERWNLLDVTFIYEVQIWNWIDVEFGAEPQSWDFIDMSLGGEPSNWDLIDVTFSLSGDDGDGDNPEVTFPCTSEYLNKAGDEEHVGYDPLDINTNPDAGILPENHRLPWIKSGGVVPTFDEFFRYLEISDQVTDDDVVYHRFVPVFPR